MEIAARPSITARAHALVDAQERKGIATYGRTLSARNGRNAPLDLAEELIDAAKYSLQWQEERSDLIAALSPFAWIGFDFLSRRSSWGDDEVAFRSTLAGGRELVITVGMLRAAVAAVEGLDVPWLCT